MSQPPPCKCKPGGCMPSFNKTCRGAGYYAPVALTQDELLTVAAEAMRNDLPKGPPWSPPPPAKQMLLPTDPAVRKGMPICTGVLDYFPLALAEVARVSKAGNDQHNPGQPLHWSKGKSTDHADCIPRHLIDRGTFDPTDNPPQRHSAKLAWRALALLQTELEDEAKKGTP